MVWHLITFIQNSDVPRDVGVFVKKFSFILIALSLLINATHADNRTINQTKNQLKQIENKMNQIQLNISRSHDKQGVLTKELSHTEKQIQAKNG